MTVTPIIPGRKIPLADQQLVGEADAAELLGVSKGTLRRLVANGQLERVQLPLRRNLYKRAALDAYVTGLRTTHTVRAERITAS